jgi:hypothetical protein
MQKLTAWKFHGDSPNGSGLIFALSRAAGTSAAASMLRTRHVFLAAPEQGYSNSAIARKGEGLASGTA